MNGYKNRVADRLLAEKLEAFGAVLADFSDDHPGISAITTHLS